MEVLKPLKLGGISSQSAIANTKALFKDVLSISSFESVFTPEAPLLDDVTTRRDLFKLWWAYVDNKIYEPGEWGGWREYVNAKLGSANAANLAPIFNPVERAVRAYEYVFDGAFGEKIKIAEKIEERDVNDKILEPIRNIWKWSNINGWKNELLLKTAALGTCGLRIEYRNDNNGKRIMFLPEHPSIIRDVELDSRDNITQIVLEYERIEGDFLDEDNPRMLYRYVEYMSKEKFWMTRNGEYWNFLTQRYVTTKEAATIPNILGIVPYVLITQTRIGSNFGIPCFYGKESSIDHLNALTAHINQQIRRHVTATWLIEGGGPPPKKVLVGDQNVWYIRKDSSQPSQVSVKDLVSKLNLSDAIKQQQELKIELSNSMPEMKATDGEFLSHQSGGTVANLRLPAEQRILGARTNIEAGLVKADQIALSLGIIHNMWNLGNGKGSRAKADEAFALGLEDHKFNERPALPLTVDDKLTISKAHQAEAAAKNPDTPGVQGGDNTAIPTSSTSA
jgi:hypothetical protein